MSEQSGTSDSYEECEESKDDSFEESADEESSNESEADTSV